MVLEGGELPAKGSVGGLHLLAALLQPVSLLLDAAANPHLFFQSTALGGQLLLLLYHLITP